ncbi:MAG: stage II sporulation protein R [Clostridiales bacterium]|jgi:stage II sporulation protein R|nr:stage II sporulation protein R [Clostridiales bacterium]
MEKKKALQEIKIIAASAAFGLLLTLCVAARTYVYSETTQAEIARNVLRFHVLANSDGERDQLLKQKVRDGVLETYREGLSASASVDETREFLTARLDDIKATAGEIVAGNGYDYPVTVQLTTDFFPTKVYGDVTFPPGNYEALRITIGEGAGQNWWCVMFPPLCYIDAAKGLPGNGKTQLALNLPEREYQLLTNTREPAIKIKFKIIEWWQNLKQNKAVPLQRVAAENNTPLTGRQ